MSKGLSQRSVLLAGLNEFMLTGVHCVNTWLPFPVAALAPRTHWPRSAVECCGRQLKPFVEADAIICLQEISLSWSGRMLPWFESRGYSLVTNCYGNPFNGEYECMLYVCTMPC